MNAPATPRGSQAGRPPTHGGRQLARLQREGKVDQRRSHAKYREHVAAFLAVRRARERLGGPGDTWERVVERAYAALDAIQLSQVAVAANIGAIYYVMVRYVFNQPQLLTAEGELLPVLRKSFLAYGNQWRRELRAFALDPDEAGEGLTTCPTCGVRCRGLGEYLTHVRRCRPTNGNGPTTDADAPEPTHPKPSPVPATPASAAPAQSAEPR